MLGGMSQMQFGMGGMSMMGMTGMNGMSMMGMSGMSMGMNGMSMMGMPGMSMMGMNGMSGTMDMNSMMSMMGMGGMSGMPGMMGTTGGDLSSIFSQLPNNPMTGMPDTSAINNMLLQSQQFTQMAMAMLAQISALTASNAQSQFQQFLQQQQSLQQNLGNYMNGMTGANGGGGITGGGGVTNSGPVAKGTAGMLAHANSMVGLNEHRNAGAINQVTCKSGINCSTTPWCAAWAMNLLKDHGVLNLDGLSNRNYCPTIKSWAQKKHIWGENRQYTPKAGDAIMFDWNNDGRTDHIGIVEKVANGKVYTIEGNSSDSVKKNSYSLGSGVIDGYLRT